MTNTKNNIPLYEEQQIINEEQLNIQQILNQFQQPTPSNFVKLEDIKHMCSTQGWKEPVCERYGCLFEGRWIQIDILHTLMDKLELAKNIPCPVYLSPTVLDKGLDHLAYTIESEEEIFLEQPLTINNLTREIKRWLTEIKTLKEKITELEQEKTTNQQTIANLQTERINLITRIRQLEQLLQGSAVIFDKQQSYINQLTQQLQKEQNSVTNSTEYNANLQQDLFTLALAGEKNYKTQLKN